MECCEGKDALPMSVKNWPWPPEEFGRWRAKATLRTSLTARLFTNASPESRPVSRGRDSPRQLPHAYIKAGTATRLATPASATFLLRATASAFERARCMLCWSLPIRIPVVPASGASHIASFQRKRAGLVQMAFWSPGRFRKTFFKDMEVSVTGLSEVANGDGGEEEEEAVGRAGAEFSVGEGFAGAPGGVGLAETSWRQAARPVTAMAINKAANRVIRNVE